MASSTAEASLQPSEVLSTTDGETAFFRSIIRYRPRGSNRHFSMVGICKDLERELQTVIPSDEIWNTLRTCYDLDILAEMEPDEPDEIERNKSTVELLRSKQHTFFREFQLPIHPSIPAEQSFQSLIDERRLESSSARSSPEQRSPGMVSSPRRRTTANSLKLHLDRSGQSSSSKYLNPSSAAKSGSDHRIGDPTIQEGMESDLTEQEDYEDDDDEEEEDKELEGKDDEEDEEEEEEEEPEPEPRTKKLKTSNRTDSSHHHRPPTTSSSRSRNTGKANKASSTTASTSTPTTTTTSINNSNNTPSSSRSRTRGRWKKVGGPPFPIFL
ncbi:uncharacterized protein PGTG_13431 [Puccinia graminis f. sp. tritici CRL 75-36-700-3]|uniref:Chromatin modification-related protein EAF7 n=2 Tax=Puccinia graminis f. sp. tritici TaxID=56615 RepID=E3KTT0_PUCGT|nr:uncharacterized protein PGTG_13431 [Puccinia graminis f. sp. tritici CRL 75-36-700-3]EFP87645.2 hypothetical protein PGTG_13431 [Puccinia graminis f. sp. tritici CRL 75-36-700-3]